MKCGTWLEKTYYPELEVAGLYLRRDDQGDLVRNIGRLPVIVVANKQGQSGMLYMDLRRKQLRQASVRTLEETAVTALLTDREVQSSVRRGFIIQPVNYTRSRQRL